MMWYTRPVLFVADVHRALGFYVGQLGFVKAWHEGDGSGGVCQVNREGCEIILCHDPARAGGSRLYIELTAEALARLPLAGEPSWWGSNVIKLTDPDGNELLFPSEFPANA